MTVMKLQIKIQRFLVIQVGREDENNEEDEEAVPPKKPTSRKNVPRSKTDEEEYKETPKERQPEIQETMKLLRTSNSKCPFSPSNISYVKLFYFDPLRFVVNDDYDGNISVKMTQATRYIQILRMERTKFEHSGT